MSTEADIFKEYQRRLDSTLAAGDLPAPRLELRWRVEGNTAFCDYNIVLKVGEWDTRKRDHGNSEPGAELRICQSVTRTRRPWSSEGRSFPLCVVEATTGVLALPYQDGMHVRWDAHQLNLPAFVVFEDRAQTILPLAPELETVPAPYREPKEESLFDTDWVPAAINYRLARCNDALQQLKNTIQLMRDSIPPESTVARYLESLQGLIAGIQDNNYAADIPTFDTWMELKRQALWERRNNKYSVVTSCAICGARLTSNLEAFCEHVLPLDATATKWLTLEE